MTQFLFRLRSWVLRAITEPESKKWWRVLLATLAVSVGWLALSPTPPGAFDSGWDKLNHACAFWALTVAAAFAFPRSRGKPVLLFAALFAFGALIEVAQSFTPTRSAEWGDLAADAVGMAAGWLAAMLLTRATADQSR